ncbi:MAG TPA: hypothetical protein VFE48_22360 [Methylomirabilota bacterium]|nr:hypothetical protein [Methylomirabilota bacterium]
MATRAERDAEFEADKAKRDADWAELQRQRAFNGLAAQMHAAVAEMKERLRLMEKGATEEIERVLDQVASLSREIERKSVTIGKLETVLRSAVADLEDQTQRTLQKHAQVLDAITTRVTEEPVAKTATKRGVRKRVVRDENNRIAEIIEEPIS